MAKSPRRRVRCRLCGRTVTINNWTGHAKHNHPEIAGQPRAQYIDEVDEPAASVELAVVARAASLPEPMDDLPPLHAEDLDEIVLAVVQQLADPQGRIPAEMLPAIFAWRAATSIFLRAVTT